MEYTLQLHSGHRKYPVPRGLHDLIADVAREVLRKQPRNIPGFIVQYLDAMVKTRKAAKGLVDAVDDAIAEGIHNKSLLRKYGLSKEEADNHAAKIQAAYRGYKARQDFKNKLLAKRKDDGELKKDKLKDSIVQILDKNELTLKQADTAATKIQAAYRGYLARKRNTGYLRVWQDSWRHDWLWKEFKMSPEEIYKLRYPELDEEEVKDISLLYVPKRSGHFSVEAERSRILSLFKGRLGDYDELLDESLSNVSLYDENN